MDIARSKDLAQDGCGSEAERSFRTRIRTEPITPWLRPGRSLSQSLSSAQRANALLLAERVQPGLSYFPVAVDARPHSSNIVQGLKISIEEK